MDYANNYFLNFVLSDLTCNQCVLQWRYVAGNNWGICPDGNGAVGCGEQEEFRSCSDIALGEGIPTPMRPVRLQHLPLLPNQLNTNHPKHSIMFPYLLYLLSYFLLPAFLLYGI